MMRGMEQQPQDAAAMSRKCTLPPIGSVWERGNERRIVVGASASTVTVTFQAFEECHRHTVPLDTWQMWVRGVPPATMVSDGLSQPGDKPLVIVRSRDAGVHVGCLQSRVGAEVVLRKARRLWRWRGANTLNEVATRGCDTTWTRLSEPVEEITVIGVCEVIPVEPAAILNLTTSRWGT